MNKYWLVLVGLLGTLSFTSAYSAGEDWQSMSQEERQAAAKQERLNWLNV